MNSHEVKVTRQHQITIPRGICRAMRLKGGERLEVRLLGNDRLLLRHRKMVDTDDPAYRLGREILEAERQIRKGETISWSEVRRRHRL